MKIFSVLSVLGVAAIAAVVLAVPAMAGTGATIKTMTTNPTPTAGIPDMAGYDFRFPNGNGEWQNFAPTSYNYVSTPSGNYNQTLTGVVANDTGATVTYTANTGGPLEIGQQCWNFDTGLTTPDWSMTIQADGNYTLLCHFHKA